MYRADDCAPLVRAASLGEIKLQALARGHYPGRRLREHALPGLKTVGHWDAVIEQKWGLPWHCNEGIEICYLESGTLDFDCGGREFTLEPGDLIVTRPWQSHRLGRPFLLPNRLHWLILDVGVRRPNQPWQWPRWLLLNQDETGQLERVLRHNDQPVWRSSPEIRHCFQLIAQAVENDHEGSQVTHLAIRINDLFLLLLELFHSHPMQFGHCASGSRQKVRSFLADLASHEQRLTQNWTLDDMAATCGLGITQFVRHVRELTNMAPMHYVNHCRLEHAARLLREQQSMSVTQVAFSCGFSSSQYFATLFRRRFGCTPRDFRACNNHTSITGDSL